MTSFHSNKVEFIDLLEQQRSKSFSEGEDYEIVGDERISTKFLEGDKVSTFGIRRGLSLFLEQARGGAKLTACFTCGATCEADRCLLTPPVTEIVNSVEQAKTTPPEPLVAASEEDLFTRNAGDTVSVVQDQGSSSEGSKPRPIKRPIEYCHVCGKRHGAPCFQRADRKCDYCGLEGHVSGAHFIKEAAAQLVLVKKWGVQFEFLSRRVEDGPSSKVSRA